MLWAIEGVVALKHGLRKEADAARAKLASWPNLFVAAWHFAEAAACDEEGAKDDAAWHRQYLAK